MMNRSSAQHCTSQVKWLNHGILLAGNSCEGRGDKGGETVLPWPIPSREAMQERWAYRQGIREETLEHRRIHRHGGMRETGRNIALVLCDRELFGGSAVTLRRLPVAMTVSEPGIEVKPRSLQYGYSTLKLGVANRLTMKDKEVESTSSNKKSSILIQGHAKLSTRVCFPMRLTGEVKLFAEYCSVIRYHSAFLRHLGGDDEPGERGERPLSSRAVSTISIAFAPDCQTMASTHGDHTVKISCCSSGRLLQTLEGHPRTPWTVKYHPVDPALLASGCLGHQVRLWHWPDRVCRQMIRLEFAIISLSFHPSGSILAVANGTRLHFWGYNQYSNGDASAVAEQRQGVGSTQSPRGSLTEVDQRHMLRCVHFPPEGNTIIIGGVNPTTDDPRRRNRGGVGGGGMSFYLRLWDFDIDAALQAFDDADFPLMGRRRAISNPRTFVPRALLYNDGGFDVSPDGKLLCACAEYWLPEGTNNAMEMLQGEDAEDYSEEEGKSEACAVVESRPNEQGHRSRERGAATPTQSDRGERGQILLATPPSSNRGVEGSRTHVTPTQQSTPSNSAGSGIGSSMNAGPLEFAPQTPPRSSRPRLALSPPSPPGRRFSGGGNVTGVTTSSSYRNRMQPLLATPNRNQQNGPGPIPPPPPPPPGMTSRPPHPLSIISGGGNYEEVMNKKGRYVPHVVTVSLDTAPLADDSTEMRATTPVARGYRPRLGQLMEASPLDGAKASAVTCVKFSPSTDFLLIGYGVREPVAEGGGQYHPVTALYRVRGGMTHVSTMLSGDDDVNIARFHPSSGYGFVYGTKQGRVRVLSPRPWNFYS